MTEAVPFHDPAFTERARMVCHGVSTDPRALRTDPEARCGSFLGYSRAAVDFTRIAARAPAHADGKYWVRCARCKTWNSFEVRDVDRDRS